jgi:hypothetical protein
MRVLRLFMFLLISTWLYSAEQPSQTVCTDLPVPGHSDMPGSEIGRFEIYEGAALWGLINGAADLYYEYGFERMALQEILWHEEEFRLELYRMTSLEGAFGIFSLSVHGCLSGGPVTTGNCLSRYQYQLYSGRYYLSLINYSGSEKARELSVKIGNIILLAAGRDYIELPGIFRQELFKDKTDHIRLINGRIGLNNSIPDAEPYFAELDDYRVWSLIFGEDEHRSEIIFAEMDNSDMVDELNNLAVDLENAGYIVKQVPPGIIAVRDRQDTRQGINLLNRIIEGSDNYTN